MSKQYSITEARANLPAIVTEAEAGQEIELTRLGRPVAVVLSHREVQRLRGKRGDFMAAYQAFIAKHPLEEWGVDEDFADSLRDRSPGREVEL